MSVAIRLRRIGRKKKPFYRVVVIDSRDRRDGDGIEELGWFNPMSDEVSINMERTNYWISVGAKPSERVATIIKKEKSK